LDTLFLVIARSVVCDVAISDFSVPVIEIATHKALATTKNEGWSRKKESLVPIKRIGMIKKHQMIENINCHAQDARNDKKRRFGVKEKGKWIAEYWEICAA